MGGAMLTCLWLAGASQAAAPETWLPTVEEVLERVSAAQVQRHYAAQVRTFKPDFVERPGMGEALQRSCLDGEPLGAPFDDYHLGQDPSFACQMWWLGFLKTKTKYALDHRMQAWFLRQACEVASPEPLSGAGPFKVAWDDTTEVTFTHRTGSCSTYWHHLTLFMGDSPERQAEQAWARARAPLLPIAAPAPVVAAAPRAVPAPSPPPSPTAPRLPSVDERLVSGQRHPADSAVVVGLEDYAFIPDVPFARRDAQAFHDLLVYARGVPPARAALLQSGSNEHLRAALERAGRETGPGGRVWVYFAGHGAASPTTRERLLLGDDVRADSHGFESRGLAVSEIERLASAGGAEVVLVLDTCFTGVGRGGTELVAGMRFAVPDHAVSVGPQAAVQWTAASANEMSGPLPDQRHGAFTYFAVGALRGWADGELSGQRDGVVTAEEANAFVSRALRAMGVVNQTPTWLGDSPEQLVLMAGVSEVGPTW